MTNLLCCLLTLIALDEWWELRFSPHPENVAVLVVTFCPGKVPFYAYQWRDIEPEDRMALVRRAWPQPQHDEGTCHTTAEVMRSPTGTVLDVYVGESAGG